MSQGILFQIGKGCLFHQIYNNVYVLQSNPQYKFSFDARFA